MNQEEKMTPQLEPIHVALYQDYELINLARKISTVLSEYLPKNSTVQSIATDMHSVANEFEAAVDITIKSNLAIEISAMDLLRDRIFISFKKGLQFNLDHFNPVIRHSAELLQKLLSLVDNDLDRLPLFEESEEVQKLEKLCQPETVQNALLRTRLDSHLSHLFELNRQTDALVKLGNDEIPYIKPLRVQIRKNTFLLEELFVFLNRSAPDEHRECTEELNKIISVFNSNANARKRRLEGQNN